MTKVKDKERILKAAREKQNQLQGNLLRLSANFSTEMGFTGGSGGKASACSAGDPCLIPGSGRSPGQGIGYPLQRCWASLVAHTVKCLWETWVQSLGQEDPLEKEMATHSSILAWKIPWREEPGRL